MSMTPRLNHTRWILASASPRRRELLAGLEIPFDVVVPAIDESVRPREMPASYTLRMAFEKAAKVLSLAGKDANTCVIAADTTVVLGGCILGKPEHAADATRMLCALSGQAHTVITGLCVWTRDRDGERVRGDAVRTRVVFRHLADEEIHHYVASGEPMDKAGAYAIQGGAAGMVDHIDGSYSNVVGLPMETLTELLGIGAKT